MENINCEIFVFCLCLADWGQETHSIQASILRLQCMGLKRFPKPSPTKSAFAKAISLMDFITTYQIVQGQLLVCGKSVPFVEELIYALPKRHSIMQL